MRVLICSVCGYEKWVGDETEATFCHQCDEKMGKVVEEWGEEDG